MARSHHGPSNLHIAIWVRDLEHLYRFLTQDLGSLGVDGAETVIVGHAVKRPGEGARRPGRVSRVVASPR